jgi:hypothetical protein
VSSNSRLLARPIPWLQIACAAWAVLALVTIALYAWGLTYDLNEPATMCRASINVPCVESEAAARLAQLGFPAWYPQFLAVLNDGVVPLVYLAVALLIFWRARQSWLGLAVSVLLLIFALWINTDVLDKLALRLGGGPGWDAFFAALGLVFFAAMVYLLFTFPTGQFTPRWMAAVAPVAVLLLFLAGGSLLPEPLNVAVLLLVLVVGLAYQFYRYRRVSTPAQRQQTKWVVAGLAGFVANAVIWYVLVDPALRRGASGVGALAVFGPLVALLALSLPIALGISILRYRLWDIDVIIRRTLIYSALTATLALVYLVCVLALQSLLRLLTGEAQNQLVTVISTLAIAALFVPVRAYVQRAIDRRFFRGKYDAARTLSDFSAAARDEVELNRLTDDLVKVVDQTMQPAQITLWLRPGADLRE